MSLRGRLDSLAARLPSEPIPSREEAWAARHRQLARLAARLADDLPARGEASDTVEFWRMLAEVARRAGGLEVDTPELAAQDRDVVQRWDRAHPFPLLPKGCAFGADTPEMRRWRRIHLEAYLDQYGPNAEGWT